MDELAKEETQKEIEKQLYVQQSSGYNNKRKSKKPTTGGKRY